MDTGIPDPGQLKGMVNQGRDSSEPDPPAPGSIESLFYSLESPLLHYAIRLTGTRPAAEDVVQEAFMRLHVHFNEVREPRRWLYRTVHNLALNQRRAASKVVPMDPDAKAHSTSPDEPCDPLPLPDEQIARWEHIGQVRLSLEAMDDRTREVVRLKFHEDLSYREISERTGLKIGHVGYLLHHALKNIAGELAKTGGVQ